MHAKCSKSRAFRLRLIQPSRQTKITRANLVEDEFSHPDRAIPQGLGALPSTLALPVIGAWR